MTTETVKPGDRFWKTGEFGSVFLVMAVADGYVMIRRPGAMPFVQSIKGLLVNYQRFPK